MRWLERLLHFGERKNLEQAERLRKRGDQLADDHLFDEAAEAYEESIRLDKSNHAAYLELARTYFNTYQPENAFSTLDRLIAADPKNAETYREVIGVYLSKGKSYGPREAGERFLAVGKKDSNYYLVKSYCAYLKYWTEGAVERPDVLPEVIEPAEESIKLDPTNASAYYLLAWSLNLKGQGEYRETEEGHWVWVSSVDQDGLEADYSDKVGLALEKCLEFAPDHVEAASLLSGIYFGEGRYEETVAACERRLKLNPSDIDARFLLAGSYVHLGRFQDTIDTMRLALGKFWGTRLSLGGHELSVKTLKLVEESDTDVSRVRSACLFASYANALFSRTAYHWDSNQRGDDAIGSCLWWYEKALAYASEEPDPLEWQVHYRAGVEYLGREMYAEARAALNRGVALHPNIYADYELAVHKDTPSPLEILSECNARMGYPAQARDALRNHVEMIRRTAEDLGDQVRSLEAQPRGSHAPWALSSLSTLRKWCGEYEAEAAQKLEELSREIDGASEQADHV